MNSVSSRSFALPGLQMHALVCGDPNAQPAVLLHGFPEFSESWRVILPEVTAAGFYAVAPDLRGYGQTDKPRQGYDVDTLAQDVVNLFTALGPRRPHLVAHDWGGAIAYHVAAMHPDRIDRLVVVNCPHPVLFAQKLRKPSQLVKSWYMFFFQLTWLPEYLLQRQGGALVARMIRAAAVDKTPFTDARLRPYAENFARPGTARCAVDYYRQAFRAFFRKSFRLQLKAYPKIQAPFRLIWGEQDIALGKEVTTGMEPYFATPPEYRFLPELGHFCPLEDPRQVGGLVLEHLRLKE